MAALPDRMRWVYIVGLFLLAGLLTVEHARPQEAAAPAQQKGTASEQERAVAERFLKVLKRRPRAGTALDRVYGFHVQNGTLDQFIESLDVPEDAPDAGQNQMILGLLQAQRGQQALAVDAFAKAEGILTEDAMCSFYLGRSFLSVGKTEQAAAAMERAIARRPARNEALPIFTELGRIYGRAGQNEQALGVWKKLEALFPGDTRVGGQIAGTLAEEGDVEAALKRYKSLSKSSPKEAEQIAFAVQAAEMQRRLGKPDEATRSLESILTRLRPGSWLYSDVRKRIEAGFVKSGDYDSLATYYQEKLADSPDDLSLRTRLGRILVSAGRLDDARLALQQAADRAPDDPDVRLALIDVLTTKGDIAGASQQFEQLAQLDPDNPDYLLRWGGILLQDEQQELNDRRAAASKIWKRLAEARSEDAVTLAQIADRMRSVDRKEDAIELYRRAINVDPASPQYREYLGEYLHQLDRQDEAIEIWQSIADGDRRNRESLVRLAEVFGTFNLNDLALKAWRDAAQLDLDFGQELRFAKKLRDASEYDEALQRLDAAESIAETPDENEQLLRDRIITFQQAGTLSEKIAELEQQDPTSANLRKLAMMHAAASQLTDAAKAIGRAIEKDPDSVDVLAVAAEVAERRNLYGDAAQMYAKLAVVDARYRSNYLQRVADLRIRLGQVDEALKTCEELIEFNSANPESYQFLARLAFRAGRDDQAVTALRRAMSVAPRDNTSREMLASAFADRYRTDEAIELYWQAMRYEQETDDRVRLVRELAPLYDRQVEIDSLIRRIEEIGREDGDRRATQLMLSAAHEAVEDYGAAREAIDRLLAQQPRDVALLETMVKLSDAADELATAAEFQQRVVSLADTPDNRFKLVQLQLNAELIDVATALSERISLASDPVRLGSMIRSAVTRGDIETATAICREAVRRDSSLWDVKLYLAELLLHDKSDQREKLKQEAIALTNEIRTADIAVDAKPPTSRISTRQPQSGRPANDTTSPQYWVQSRYEMQRGYRLGRYASASYGYGYSQPRLIQPRTFGHARIIAALLQIVAVAQDKPGKELDSAIETLRADKFPLPPLSEVTDANVLWEFRAFQSMASDLQSKKSNADSSTGYQGPTQLDVKWRIAQLDPEHGASALTSALIKRAEEAAKKNEKSDDHHDEDGEPNQSLTAEQLELLVDLYEKAKARLNELTTSSVVTLWTYIEILNYEFKLAGNEERAKQFAIPPLGEDVSLDELLSAISFHLRFKRVEQADALVDRMLTAARHETFSGNIRTSQLGSTRNLSQYDKEFVQRHRLTILDALIARSVRRRAKSQRRTSTLSDGTVQAYALTPQGYYATLELKAPLSSDLLSQDIVTDVAALIPDAAKNNRSANLIVPTEIRDHLEKPLEGAPAYETKTRLVLAAYANWWAKQPADCYQSLIKLCEQFPDDVDLQIERARLASELKQPRIALDTLDSFSPLDSRMMVRKEMAAMNLASQLGDVDRARQSAERLFGMRMDTSTQLALADQLRRLGMSKQAAAVLRRLRTGRSRDERTELKIARSFLTNDDQESAAEVAYTVLRRLGSGRSNQSNSDYYRQQAVSILRSAKKLDGLIERSERRLKSTPNSTRARIELAELYTAAGRSKDADKLWEQVADKTPHDPRQMVARASALSNANKHKEAAMMYLDSFEKAPQLFRQHFHNMTQEVRQADIADEMFTRLLKCNPNMIPGYRIDELLRVGDQGKYSEAKRKFLLHSLKGDDAQSYFYQIVSSIPQTERDAMPELKELMLDAVCNENAFSPNTNVWSISSYQSGGKAQGGLAEIVTLLTSDQQAMKRFIKAAEDAKKDESRVPTANLLTALLDIEQNRNKDQAVEVIRELTKTEDSGESTNRGDATNTTLRGSLLWQVGQMLEEVNDIEDRPALLIGIYRMAARARDMSHMNNSMDYSVGRRLVEALQDDDQHSKARRFLLDAYASTDNSADNRHNPGYGDSQDLSAYYSTANTLNSVGCPVDALVVCRTSLADPAKFAVAKRWNSSNSIKRFEELAEKCASNINPQAAIDYLSWIAEDLAESEPSETPAIQLLDLPVRLLSGETKPGFQLAIETAAETDEGRAQIENFGDAVGKLAKDNPDDWSLTAAQLAIAISTDSAEIEALAKTLMKQLPPDTQLAAVIGKPANENVGALTGLFTPMAIALQSKNEIAQKVGLQLATYMKSVAKCLQEPNLRVVLASMAGGDRESLEEFFTALEAKAAAGGPLPESELSACLEVAKSAAKVGDVILSTRALKLALQHGPPLRQLGPTGTDAFAINRNSSNVNQPIDSGIETLTTSLCEIVNLYADATGEKLGAKQPDKGKKQPGDHEAMIKAIADTLQTVVLPGNQVATAFPYAKSIASATSYDNYSDDFVIVPESASIAMARSAASAGQSDQLLDLLRTKLEKADDKETIASVMIDVAYAAKNADAIAEAIDHFSASFDDRLPKEFSAAPAEQLRTITSQMQEDSKRKSVMVNTLMRTLWPMSQASDFPPPEISDRVSTLLMRTAALIDSDAYTARRHPTIATKIRQKMLKLAAGNNRQDEFDRLLKIETDALRQQFASYQIEDRETYERNGLKQLMNRLASHGLLMQLPGFIRELIADIKSPTYHNLEVSWLCLQISSLEPDQQFDVLKRIALGESKDDPVLHWGAFVKYSQPPKLVARQTPRLADIMSLSTCGENVPIVDTILMLADVAAELGKSESLADEFSSRSKAPGDPADIASALARLAGSANDPAAALNSIEPTLEAVANDLAKNKPDKDDKEPVFPDLAWYLIARATADLPSRQADKLLQEVTEYAARGKFFPMLSTISRVRAVAGLGPAANAKPTSPLKHFHVVSIPMSYHPDMASLAPLYTVDTEGAVCGTSGQELSLLMLKYPIAGTFTFSINVRNGTRAEADVSYGGVLYPPAMWSEKARLAGLGNRQVVEIPVASIKKWKDNRKGLRVSPDETVGLCNDQPYVTDITATSFPFVGISHLNYRTYRVTDIELSGDVTIPREVGLIHPTMRGWTTNGYGNGLPDPLLPIGPEQNADLIKKQRQDQLDANAIELPEAIWSVKDGVLHYRTGSATYLSYDPSSHIQYIRPLLDGETIEYSVWWQWGKTEVYPSVGRTVLQLGKDGTTPSWENVANDLNLRDFVQLKNLDPPAGPVAKDNIPIDESWNKITMTRRGEVIAVQLNDKPLAEIPVAESTRPGLLRPEQREAKVRTIKLTGDWPTELPEELLDPR